MQNKGIQTFLVAATWVAILGPAMAQGMESRPSGLSFEDCRLVNPVNPGAVNARCGMLTVPENPQAPAGRQIEIHIAIVPALNRRAATDPLFVLAGGPGQAASEFYAAYAGAFARIARDRDIVLVDQRGTGRSAPLTCEYPDDPSAAAIEAEALKAATQECLRVLAGDPRFYTTSVAVIDLDAVRVAAGYERINLYGVSYGTRVAQHYARRFPARVRSLVLDGAVPPEQILGPDTAIDAQRALDGIFARCRASPACDARFPQLEQAFATLRARLATPLEFTFPDPATGKTQTLAFGLQHLYGVVRLLSYSDTTASLLPLLIHVAAVENNVAPLAAQHELLTQAVDAQFAYGMHNAVVCTEDIALLDPDQLDRRAEAAAYMGTAPLDGLLAVCSAWPQGLRDADLHAPLASDVPVLILSGGNDPATPSRYGDTVLKQFRNGRHIVLDDYGHGQLTAPCVANLLAGFITHLAVDTDDVACAAQLQPAPFLLDFTGPGP